jgi:hypothetical protein
VPTLVWLDLQTVDEIGLKVPKVKLSLDPGQAEPYTVETDGGAYWSGRVRAGDKIRVRMEDGRPVRFGASQHAQSAAGTGEDTAILAVRVAGRTVTDIVVPTLDKKLVDEREELVRRHGRLPRGGRRRSARSGAPSKHTGEKAGKISGRGAEGKKFSRRTVGNYIADNLCIAAGFEAQEVLKRLVTILKEWLGDHHPTAIARGYFLQVIVGEFVLLYDSKQELVGEYKLGKGMGIVKGRFGAYAPFEFFGARGHMVFTDMATQTGGFAAGHLETIKKSLEERMKTEPGADSAPGEGSADPPAPLEGEVKFVWELIEEAKQDEYKQLVLSYLARREVEVAYLYPAGGRVLYLARCGGTGLLEDYPPQDHPAGPELRDRVHQRNLEVARHIKKAYEIYLANYIQSVKDIPSKPVAGKPHPEVQLYRLGPPDSAFAYPRPAGATIDEYRAILLEGGASAFSAWREIAKKLDAIWGQRSEGSVWLVVEFSAEAGYAAGFPIFSGANAKLNFEVTEDFKIVPKSETEVPLTLQAVPSALGLPANAKYSKKFNDKTGRANTTVGFNVGKYGIEACDDGNMKFGIGSAYSEWNRASAEGGFGLDISLRDKVVQYFLKTRGIDKVPDWVGDLPDLKMKIGLYFKLVTEGTLLKIVSRSPGFFQMRPRTEFVKLDWDSLDWDEQEHLKTLGWGELDPANKRTVRWNTGARPASAKKQFFGLEAVEKVAATRIPVPTSDPYWLEFWYAFSQSRKKHK